MVSTLVQAMVPASVPASALAAVLLLVPVPSQQVGIVLQAIHVWQQQLSGLQRQQVLQVVVVVPRGKDVWTGVAGMWGHSRGREGG